MIFSSSMVGVDDELDRVELGAGAGWAEAAAANSSAKPMASRGRHDWLWFMLESGVWGSGWVEGTNQPHKGEAELSKQLCSGDRECGRPRTVWWLPGRCVLARPRSQLAYCANFRAHRHTGCVALQLAR